MFAIFEIKNSKIIAESLLKPESLMALTAEFKKKEASITLSTQLVPATDHTSLFEVC